MSTSYFVQYNFHFADWSNLPGWVKTQRVYYTLLLFFNIENWKLLCNTWGMHRRGGNLQLMRYPNHSVWLRDEDSVLFWPSTDGWSSSLSIYWLIEVVLGHPAGGDQGDGAGDVRRRSRLQASYCEHNKGNYTTVNTIKVITLLSAESRLLHRCQHNQGNYTTATQSRYNINISTINVITLPLTSSR